MSNKILFEDDQGRINKVMPGPPGAFLVTGKSFAWKKADAGNITYTSPESGSLANVAMALDQALQMIRRVQVTVATLEEENRRIDGQQSDMLVALRTEVSDMNRHFQEISTKVLRASHQRTTVSIASNAALTIDTDRQTLSLNLAAKGSFDDSRAGLGVASVQLALESMAAKQKEMAYVITALQETVKSLQKQFVNSQGD